MKKIEITEGTISEVVEVSNQIPEFTDTYSEQEYKNRLFKKLYLILIAKHENRPVGFKLGYEQGNVFYSWLGGVIPEYRRMGIAGRLAQYQEKWAREKGFERIALKTLNRYKAMLLFTLNNGFSITGTEPFDKEDGLKIILEKKIANTENYE